MKIRHIQSLDIWLLSKGNRVLYRGRHNPWRSERILKGALRREGLANGDVEVGPGADHRAPEVAGVGLCESPTSFRNVANAGNMKR